MRPCLTEGIILFVYDRLQYLSDREFTRVSGGLTYREMAGRIMQYIDEHGMPGEQK